LSLTRRTTHTIRASWFNRKELFQVDISEGAHDPIKAGRPVSRERQSLGDNVRIEYERQHDGLLEKSRIILGSKSVKKYLDADATYDSLQIILLLSSSFFFDKSSPETIAIHHPS
jgi:hypothetical protein